MEEMIESTASRGTIRDQVMRHPLVAFVILAYAISWIGWPLSDRIDLGVVNGFGIIGSLGPALAAIIVSALLRPEPSTIPARSRWWLCGLTGLAALALMAVRRLWITPAWLAVAGEVTTTIAYPTVMAFVVDVLAAALVGFCVSGLYSSRQGVADLLHTLDPRCQPVRWPWWLIAVGLYPVVIGLGNVISAGLGLMGATSQIAGPWYLLALDMLLTYLVFLFHGGGLEEPGWRGFALPLLQNRFGPLRSSLVLAVIWAFWHWPFFWAAGLGSSLVALIIYLVLEVAPLVILFTAVFNRTRGSLPIAILLHTSINVTSVFMPASTLATGLWVVSILGVAIWMWRSPQTFSPQQA